ncbi:helix-turn-helix domain-containing protein [Clostridium botulinum]|nr:helix-turn-helix domain-containing protein [Clostridium botulinum]NFI49643.1 helix-turn-helix domain-containing protein [Clostridium botulinum]NFI58573.1 helix-turn-helix domain-containing protein [Clostridium botulinum]NFI69386.1 helix-turn-helix domain-containing protein [Clostridium botulinum]NFI87147.1 helix-turn-helix domain-containing protein [Clostridium botulinum]
MPDIIVTSELASIIKRERTNVTPRLSAKDLSKYIGKSETYISTLERGNIKNIDEDTFIQIFKKINNCSDKEFNDYLNNILNEGLSSIELTEEELENQKWMYQLNLIIRQIPIPTSVVAFIKNSLTELDKTYIDLTNKINENTYLDNKENYEDNKLYILKNQRSAYKFNINNNIINKILNRDIKSTNYITMLGIIYNIFLLKGDGDKVASNYAKDFLLKHKFYNLEQILEARHQHAKKEINTSSSDFSFKLPKYELEFEQSLKSISNYIERLRDIKVNLAYSVVRTVEENLLQYNKDGFVDMIYTIPFGKLLKDCTQEQKQEFLDNIFRLIKDTLDKNESDQTNTEFKHQD